jgi:hypothetical protein
VQTDFTLAAELTEEGVGGELRIAWPQSGAASGQRPNRSPPQDPPQHRPQSAMHGRARVVGGGRGLAIVALVLWVLWWMFPGTRHSPEPASIARGAGATARPVNPTDQPAHTMVRSANATANPSSRPSSGARAVAAAPPSRVGTPEPKRSPGAGAVAGPMAPSAASSPGSDDRAREWVLMPLAPIPSRPPSRDLADSRGTPSPPTEAARTDPPVSAPPVDLLRHWQDRM